MLLIDVDAQIVVAPNQVERAWQEMKKLDVNNRPACVQRLLKRLEDDQSKDALAKFQKKVQGWWQSWSALGAPTPSKEGMGAPSVGKAHQVMAYRQSSLLPAANLDALKNAVENWQTGITLSGTDRCIANEIVLAWLSRIEAVKAIDERIKAISEFKHSNKPNSRGSAKSKMQDVVNKAVDILCDFPPEVLWLRHSAIEDLAVPNAIPREIEHKIRRGRDLVEESVDRP